MRVAFLVLLLVGLLGCGSSHDPRFSQTNVPGAGQLSISGFVSAVQVTTAGTNLGPNSVVTVVTFIAQTPQAGTVGTLTFCGDLAHLFVLTPSKLLTSPRGKAAPLSSHYGPEGNKPLLAQ
jgi:hypothetical protein